jgi:hypothetical protein
LDSNTRANIERSLHRVSSKFYISKETGTLIVEDVLVRGAPTVLRFELGDHLGIVDGHLAWGYKGFHKLCDDISVIAEDDGIILEVSYAYKAGSTPTILRFNLSDVLCVFHGQIQLRYTAAGMSVMLSEVPWMKFKVIAEPDYSIFAQDPVVKMMMSRIAQSTVEHVTVEMSAHITAAMESAVSVVMASAMQHVSEQLQAIVQGATVVGKAHAATTSFESLHIS